MLTKKQHDLLLFIDRYIKERGYSPSFAEMTEAVGLRSKSNIYRLVEALTERGFIRRLPLRARALEVLRLPSQQTLAPLPIENPLMVLLIHMLDAHSDNEKLRLLQRAYMPPLSLINHASALELARFFGIGSDRRSAA